MTALAKSAPPIGVARLAIQSEGLSISEGAAASSKPP